MPQQECTFPLLVSIPINSYYSASFNLGSSIDFVKITTVDC